MLDTPTAATSGIEELIAGFRRRDIAVDFVVGGLLKYVGFVELPEIRRFVVADNFRKGNVVDGREITYVDDNFNFHYGDLVEENVPARVIHVWELVKKSLDETIITLMGKDDPRTAIHLAHMFHIMGMGEKGHGRLDGDANFGYKQSPKDGKRWVPFWLTGDRDLVVGASSSSSPLGWNDSHRVSAG